MIDPVTGLSSPGFGGLFRESDTLNLYLLDPSQQKAEELALEIVGWDILEGARGVRALQGQYTWEQLAEWGDTLRKPMYEVRGVDRIPFSDETRNRLTVRIDREQNPNVETEIENLLKQLGVPREAVVLLE